MGSGPRKLPMLLLGLLLTTTFLLHQNPILIISALMLLFFQVFGFRMMSGNLLFQKGSQVVF